MGSGRYAFFMTLKRTSILRSRRWNVGTIWSGLRARLIVLVITTAFCAMALLRFQSMLTIILCSPDARTILNGNPSFVIALGSARFSELVCTTAMLGNG